MQREAPLTPKSSRLNVTTVGVSTPGRSASNARLATHRATLAPNDFLLPAPGLFGKKKNHQPSRQSVMPAISSRQLSTPACPASQQFYPDTTRKPESDNKDSEMRLIYDRVLRASMMKLSLRNKLDENEKTVASQLALLAKEEDAVREKLSSMRAKERNLQNLAQLQNRLDNHLEDIATCLDYFDGRPVELLTLLSSTLEFLDTLKCADIAISASESRLFESNIGGLLEKSEYLLRTINSAIGSRRDAVTIADRGLDDFRIIYKDVRNYAKKCEEALEQLQILILKEGSRSLSQNYGL